ncbi:beta-N-acetylhexosaminidase [Neptunicoccus sediminis]|uniref:beta-N-acetylhexosaminidase n=1 Tax=Neptunicoccus sediminis TaxID=1892596 RepID=UPI000845DE3B|nr:beta-N-acetylhexosaminidase [Neptunicoccus sediminis]
MAPRAAIFGCLGPVLSAAETAFFRDADPWGFILFARNIETPDQLRKLTAHLRESVGRDAPILIDQEGGRVARLRPPHWREWDAALDFAQRAGANAPQAMHLRGRMIAAELYDLGIDVNCAPMLDVATDDSHEIILNRCYGHDPETVAANGRALAEGQLAGGVLPIIKHIPGHGRASLDSHFDLPKLDTPLADLQASDFVPFSRLSDLPMAMTAHIIYSAIDPQNCATLSPAVIDVIRQDIGFGGLLMTDDLSMKALSGSFEDRTARALTAGCDVVLHCNGERAEMEPILSETPALSGLAATRAEAALAQRHTPEPFDPTQAEDALALLREDAVHG